MVYWQGVTNTDGRDCADSFVTNAKAVQLWLILLYITGWFSTWVNNIYWAFMKNTIELADKNYACFLQAQENDSSLVHEVLSVSDYKFNWSVFKSFFASSKVAFDWLWWSIFWNGPWIDSYLTPYTGLDSAY